MKHCVALGFSEGKHLAPEDDDRKDTGNKGFAGLSSMVSDVDAALSNAAKKAQPRSDKAAPPAASTTASAFGGAPSERSEKLDKTAGQSSKSSSLGLWLFGVIALFAFMLSASFWATFQTPSNGVSATSDAYSTPITAEEPPLPSSIELTPPQLSPRPKVAQTKPNGVVDDPELAATCTESDSSPRELGEFNVDRAYPQRVKDQGIEGIVEATLTIDENGLVVGEVITYSNPPGVFDAAVEREVKRMRFEPARRNCENVAGEFPLRVDFVLPKPCAEGEKNPRKLRDFNWDRAYPQRAVDRGIEGRVWATLQIDATGSVVGFILISADPPGVFESAVEREARRMRFEPARRNCKNVAGDYPLEVTFVLGE